MKNAYRATFVATLLLIALTGIGIRERHLASLLPQTTVDAQEERAPPGDCKVLRDFEQLDIQREYVSCSQDCIDDQYGGCHTMCQGQKEARERQANADLRECLRIERGQPRSAAALKFQRFLATTTPEIRGCFAALKPTDDITACITLPGRAH